MKKEIWVLKHKQVHLNYSDRTDRKNIWSVPVLATRIHFEFYSLLKGFICPPITDIETDETFYSYLSPIEFYILIIKSNAIHFNQQYIK